jgi:hypothetical protein
MLAAENAHGHLNARIGLMQGDAWIALLRRVPLNLHDGLILSLTTGAEVVVQKFVKLEPDYVILRGRMAGTQDSGRVVILPYSNIVSINVTRRLLEAEIDGIFGKETQGFAASVPLTAVPAAETGGGDTPLDTAEAVAEANAGSALAKPAMPSKTALLAKLRARLNEANRAGG